DHGGPGPQRRAELPAGQQQREVPGCDGGDHPERPAFHRRVTAFVVLDDLARRLQVSGGAEPARGLGHLERRRLERFTLLAGQDGGQLRLGRGHRVGRLAGRGDPGLVVLSPVARGRSGGHRVTELPAGALWGVREHLAGGRVDHPQRLLSGGPRTVDGHGELTHAATLRHRPDPDDTIHLSTVSVIDCNIWLMTDTLSGHHAEGEPASVADGYDLFGADYRDDPVPTWRAVRGGACPVAHTAKWGGSYMLSRYDDIRDAARAPERFSSRAVEVAGPLEAAGGLYLPPLTSDPPEQKPHRDVLMPFFMPKRTAAYEDFIRAEARALAEKIAAAGAGDAVSDYAQHLTLAVLTRMLGVPPGGRFAEWMVRMIRVGPRDQAVRAEAVREILGYLEAQLTDRIEHPTNGDDLLSYLVDAEVDGVALSRKQKLGSAFLVLIAGAD